MRRDTFFSENHMDDMSKVANFVDQVVLKERRELLKDAELITDMKEILERVDAFLAWQGVPFDRVSTNASLTQGDHLELMHQQA